jgi:hypothetical protein
MIKASRTDITIWKRTDYAGEVRARAGIVGIPDCRSFGFYYTDYRLADAG